MRQFVSKPSPAMIVACIALFVGMTGAGYAATKIGSAQIKNNAVLSKHIKNGQVRTGDLRANAVNGAKIADNTVAGEDVKDGTLSGVDVTNGSIAGLDLANNSVDSAKVSDDSLTGADIEEGTLGQVPDATTVGGRAPGTFVSSSIYKLETTIGPGQALGDGTFVQEKTCNAGDVLLSGGPASVAATSTMVESFPQPGTTNGWKVRINKNAQPDDFVVVILCADQ